MKLNLQLPNKLQFLFTPKRYKIAYGGRGASKSWGFAIALLTMSLQRKLRIGCFREIQNSIKESVHKLLSDQISRLGLDSEFEITDRSIKSRIGSEFIFEGLFRNVNRIKSIEGLDIAWVEEAEKVSEDSWNVLTPTIRKDNSEIWISFNTQYEDDPTYKRFVANPPDESTVVNINYYDNPWFPEVLRAEMEQDKARDHAKFQNIWMGKPLGSGRRIWTAFEKEIHIREFSMEQIAKASTCYMAMDPHSHYYPFCLWVAIIPKNERMRWPEDFYKHVYSEWPSFDTLGGFYHDNRAKLLYQGSLSDLARAIQAEDGIEYGIQIHKRFLDPRFAKGSGAWNWSTSTDGIVSQFAKPENGGLLFHGPDIKTLDSQRQIVHSDMLFNRNIARNQFNEPSFSVSPKCRNLIASMMNHRLEEGSERESEKYKDASDTLRIAYAGFSKLGYQQKNEQKQKVVAIAGGRGFW